MSPQIGLHRRVAAPQGNVGHDFSSFDRQPDPFTFADPDGYQVTLHDRA